MTERSNARPVVETPAEIVLILGAGSAVDYDLPTGEKLRQDTINESGVLVLCPASLEYARRRYVGLPNTKPEPEALVPITEEMNALTDQQLLQQADEHQRKFRLSFRKSGQRSIDAFAATAGGSSFAELSRRVIAARIHEYEVAAARGPNLASGWYQLLFHLAFDRSGFPHRGLRIITFNYDCTLETALIQMVRYSHGLDVAVAKERVLSIPIHHVYGATDLDYLIQVSESEFTGARLRPFARAAATAGNAYWIGRETERLAKEILLIREERLDDERIQTRVKWVAEAKEVHFLGFGFDSNNLFVAGTHHQHPQWTLQLGSKFITATTMGMTPRQVDQAKSEMGIHPKAIGYRLDFQPVDCYAALNKNWGNFPK